MDNSRVVLIEDNCDDEFLALRTLRRLGYDDVAVARDGKEAVAMLVGTEDSLPPSLPVFVLLDLRLPKLDGLDVLRAIRANETTRDLPVYVLSSSEDPTDMDVCRNLGVLAIIAKPLDMHEFGRLLTLLP